MRRSEALFHAERAWEGMSEKVIDDLHKDREKLKLFVAPLLSSMKDRVVKQFAEELLEDTADLTEEQEKKLLKVFYDHFVNKET